LIVEDRDVVRELTRDVLEASGFEVAAVSGGAEALEVVADGEPFDALLTDVVMPEMSGADLAHALRADRPELPVVYMSATPTTCSARTSCRSPPTAFVRKPFSNAELVAAVRGVIDYWDSAALANANSSASVSAG